MFDLAAPATVQDPYPAYSWLRQHEPVHLWETDGHPTGGMWLVTRYPDVRDLAADDRLTKRPEKVGLPDDVPHIVMFEDPPEHTRLRRPATATFTRRRVERLRSEVEREVVDLCAPILDGARVEVVAQLAQPLPLITIMRLLGLPMEDAHHLHELSNAILDTGDTAAQTAAVRAGTSVEDYEAEIRRTEDEAAAYMLAHVARKATEPGPDLTSALLDPASGGGLSEPDVAMMAMQLLVNGHLSTVNLIGTGLYHLLANRQQWEALVADPGLIDGAVEECLRYDAPTQRTSARWTLEDIAVAGVTIPAGHQVAAVMGSANRDPAVFVDPDRFDVARSPNPHLSFGHGRHHCPGAAMTRMEMVVLLQHLVTHAPDLGLVSDEVTFRPNSIDRGLVSLEVQRGAA